MWLKGQSPSFLHPVPLLKNLQGPFLGCDLARALAFGFALALAFACGWLFCWFGPDASVSKPLPLPVPLPLVGWLVGVLGLSSSPFRHPLLPE